MAGLVCLKPGARTRLFYRTRVHHGRKGERRSMSEADYTGLITAAHQELQAPVILVWDRLNTHVSAVMRAFVSSHPGWLTEVRLPAAPPTAPCDALPAARSGPGATAAPTGGGRCHAASARSRRE